MKKLIDRWTKKYCLLIVATVFSIILFFIGYFVVFKSDETLDTRQLAYFSVIFAIAGEFVISCLYWLIARGISSFYLKTRSKSWNESIDMKKMELPKYLSINWWTEDYCYRIVGLVVIINMLVLTSFGMWLVVKDLTIIAFLECFFVILPFEILVGFQIAILYCIIVEAISIIYSKVKSKMDNVDVKNERN